MEERNEGVEVMTVKNRKPYENQKGEERGNQTMKERLRKTGAYSLTEKGIVIKGLVPMAIAPSKSMTACAYE